MMGIQPLSWVMRPFAQTVHPAEIINAYVHFEERQGKGVGRALVKTIEDESKSRDLMNSYSIVAHDIKKLAGHFGRKLMASLSE